jgi:hypothetical protein
MGKVALFFTGATVIGLQVRSGDELLERTRRTARTLISAHWIRLELEASEAEDI